MPWFAIVMIAVLALSSGARLAMVGRTPQPVTAGGALASLVVNGLFIWGIVALVNSACF